MFFYFINQPLAIQKDLKYSDFIDVILNSHFNKLTPQKKIQKTKI